MLRNQKALGFGFCVWTLFFFATMAFAAEEKLAIIKNDASNQSYTLQIYNPPLEPEGDLGAKLFKDVRISGNMASFATENTEGTQDDEFVFISQGRRGSNGLHIYAVTPENNDLSFRLVADDRYIGRNTRFATLCDCDSDSEKEAAVIQRQRNGNYQLVIYDLPADIRGSAEIIAEVADIGTDIVGLSAGDMAGDGKEELVIARRNSDDTVSIEIYQPPGSSSEDLGLPLLSYSNLDGNIIPDGLAVGDFDDDSNDEIAIVRSRKNGDHSLEIFAPPTAAGDEAPVAIASDLSIGQSIFKIAAVEIGATGLPAGQLPEAVIDANPLQGPAPLAVTLDGGNSQDADGSIEEYRWQLGDGQAASGLVVEKTYDVPGTYGVTLTVTDNEGNQDSAQISIEVTQTNDNGGGGDSNNGNDNDNDKPLSIEQELIKLINQERQKHNLSPLESHDALATAAKRHSKDMAENNFLSHTGSDGSSPFTRIRDAGYPYRTAGENVAAGYPSAQAVFNAWMGSSGHRQNMLNGSFCELGVGYVSGGGYGHYWTLTLGCR